MNATEPVLQITGLRKSYRGPDGSTRLAVNIHAFVLAAGERCGLSGDSGCGKTTFLNLVAGLLRPDAGSIRLCGCELTQLDEAQRDRFRARFLGYIFQSFHLLPGHTCLENVLLGMAFGVGEDRRRAAELLDRVGLGRHLHHWPRQLSTGQQQRVAVARALANRPRLVLADEPTGNLDRANAREVVSLIGETCREAGAALLLVSHDPEVLADGDTVREFTTLSQLEVRA
jgi:putative ABC transport system ATP-binding protein